MMARRSNLSIDEYVQGVLQQNRTILAQTITLIESNASNHKPKAQEVLEQLIPYTGRSIRIGITGVPGAGKSTFIETLGNLLCSQGHRVAVLAVDPSSSVTRGSILGDKTRMELLSRNPNAFIRPSASGGTLGGVTQKTRETIMVCEAAGFDVILVETVGVGQSEVAVRSMVDFFLLILLTGAGDELQGIKKGVMELCDAILINKADGENRIKALATKAELNRILHVLSPATAGWQTQAFTCSALTGEGVREIWSIIQTFQQKLVESGIFDQRRQSQALEWVFTLVEEYIKTSFYNNPTIHRLIPTIREDVLQGRRSAAMAAQDLIQVYENRAGSDEQN